MYQKPIAREREMALAIQLSLKNCNEILLCWVDGNFVRKKLSITAPSCCRFSTSRSLPSLAKEIVPRSSETTMHKASVNSAKPKAAECRVPTLLRWVRFFESGRWEAKRVM